MKKNYDKFLCIYYYILLYDHFPLLKFNTLLGLNLLTQSHEQGITPVDNVFEALQELLNINNYKRNMDKLALKRKPQTSTPMDVLNHIALQARIIIWRFSSGNRMTDNRDYL